MGSMSIGNIQYVGLYSWASLHKLILSWMKDRRYAVDDKTYKYKVGGSGEEIEWLLWGRRNQTEYVKFIIALEVRVWDQVQVEVIKDGKKEKMDKGRVEIKLSVQYDVDFPGMFKKTKGLQKLGKFLNNKILGGDRDEGFLWWDSIYYEGYRFFTEIKKNLKMETTYSAY